MRCNDPEVLLLLLLLPFFFRVAHWTLADQPRPSCALFQSAGHSSAEESEPCRTLFSSPAGARALLLFLLCRSSFVFCLFFFLAAPAIKNERSVPPPFLDRIDLGRQKLNDATTASRAETALPHTQTPKKKRNALQFHRPSRTNQERPMRTGRRNLLPSPSPLRRRRRRRRRRKRRVARLANDQRGPTASQTFQPMKIEFKWQPIGRRDGPERSSRRRRRAQTEPKQKRNDHGAKGRPGSGHRPVPKQKTVESGQCKLSSSSSSLLREAHFTVVWLTS